MADVVPDVLQTPIFVVAAVADINLRRISQLNKNVCYGCYTKNGRLLHVCYNVCYSCYKRVHKYCEQLQHISSSPNCVDLPNWTSDWTASPRSAARLRSYRRFTSVDHPACIVLDVGTSAQQLLHPNPTRTVILKAWPSGAGFTSEVPYCRSKRLILTGLTGMALSAVLHCLNSGTLHPFNRPSRSEDL